MKIAGVVVFGLLLAGCASGGDDATSSSSSAPASGGVIPYADDSTPASIAEPADDTIACHVLLDELVIGTVPSTYLDAIILSLSFPNGTGAEAVDTYKQTVLRAQAPESTPALTSDLNDLSGYMDSYGTAGQAAPATIKATVTSIRATCAAVGVLPAH